MTRAEINAALAEHHYLGPTKRGMHYYSDDIGILVFGRPASRNLPSTWLELQRWCIISHEKNGGSKSWGRCVAWLRQHVEATTIISYSDPAVGHTGALYRACNWLWAPTWHRIVTPPTGLGSWVTGVKQEAKDRWVYPLARDEAREKILELGESYQRRWPGLSYVEPVWKRGAPILQTGGGEHKLLAVVHAERRTGIRDHDAWRTRVCGGPTAVGGSTPSPRSTCAIMSGGMEAK